VFEAGCYCSYHGKLETNYIIFGNVEEFYHLKKISKEKKIGDGK
jgi:hypothetical protein